MIVGWCLEIQKFGKSILSRFVGLIVGWCLEIQKFGKSADWGVRFPYFEMDVSLASSSLILISVCPFTVLHFFGLNCSNFTQYGVSLLFCRGF